MDHSNDAVVWTDVEALFGLPAGAGVTVSGLVGPPFVTLTPRH
jgi:hypothetical protein